MTPLSCYILTKNSQKYLELILRQAGKVADEIVIIDSGGTDNTLAIANQFHCKIIFHPFNNFRDQRSFAQQQCTHDMVLFMDSDEIPSDALISSIESLKREGFRYEAYEVRREWFAFGKKVHVVYPVVSPDYPIRILHRQRVAFDERSTKVHETPFGFASKGRIDAPLFHHTFESQDEMERKLQQYTDIAARDLTERKGKVPVFKMLTSPLFAFIKWYFIKGAWRDGRAGISMGQYVFRYTLLKYRKALQLKKR